LEIRIRDDWAWVGIGRKEGEYFRDKTHWRVERRGDEFKVTETVRAMHLHDIPKREQVMEFKTEQGVCNYLIKIIAEHVARQRNFKP